MATVSVDELQRAWSAVTAGQFRAGATQARAKSPAARERTAASGQAWTPEHRVVPVLGVHGGAGCTTTAMALATAAGAARVVEAASITASGLAGAATAELGEVGRGWLRGRRGEVVLDRLGQVLGSPEEVPVPAAAAQVDLTVLDAGWEASSVYLSQGWLADSIYPHKGPVILVAMATVPGMRHLEGALHLLDTHCQPVAAVIGGPRRRWPTQVRAAMGARTNQLDADGSLVPLPHSPALAVAGLDTTPLPSPVLTGAKQILQLIGLDTPHTHNKKGSLR